MDRDDPAYRGQSDYSRALLRLYDPLVLGPIARFVWRFPTDEHVRLYRQHIRPNHLDVGPGTGYFLEHAGLPAGSRVTILDPNLNVLRHVTRRLRDLEVTAVQADVLKPLPTPGPFDSAALSLVLHCLPGPMERKALAIANVARVMTSGGVLFGASVLGRSGRHTRLGRAFLWAFNKRGAFGNLDDTEAGLRDILERSFRDVKLETVAGTAVFVASDPYAPRAS
jgi:ubiquinone/menaquinone biosynthesis C-methylase UbiE